MNKDREKNAYQLAKDLCIHSGELLECFQWQNPETEKAKEPAMLILKGSYDLLTEIGMKQEDILTELRKS